MADIRSMLRAERESRRITHPHASYTSAGNLICNICEVPIKSERAWGAHLHTTQHSLRLGRERDAAQIRIKEDVVSNKKRKAVEFEDDSDTERKRVKSIAKTTPAHGEVPEVAHGAEVEEPATAETLSAVEPVQDDVTADELEALERNLASLEEETTQNNLSALSAAATISAPALMAHELAAQAREEQSKQRTRRDEEIENEREDAARALEEEFDEMDSLQERVKKLREQREALRSKAGQAADGVGTTQQMPTMPTSLPDRTSSNSDEVRVDEEDESDEEAEEDDWKFGAK